MYAVPLDEQSPVFQAPRRAGLEPAEEGEMMANGDLISRAALDGMKLFVAPGEKPDKETIGWNRAIDYVMSTARAVDAVEVVRCKDCKHWTQLRNFYMIGNCNRAVSTCTPGSFFCADGKRKTNAEVTDGNLSQD